MSLNRPTLLAGAAAALLMVACGSSDTTSTTSTTSSTSSTSTAPAVATPSPTAPATPAATPIATAATTTVATGALSGTWSGQYSGAYQGTFTLTWQQTDTKLVGTIQLTSPPQTLHITGAVEGSAITFGTVGSVGITYTGSVSGSSMSGTYKVGGASGGSWSASKTA